MPRCKFKCRSKTDFDDGFSNIHLEAVRDGSKENKTFFKDPSGFFDLQNVNQDVANQFNVGKEYFIDITPVEEV